MSDEAYAGWSSWDTWEVYNILTSTEEGCKWLKCMEKKL